MPGPARVYASAAEKQKVYRRRKAFAASDTARLIALQEAAADEHVVVCGKFLHCNKRPLPHRWNNRPNTESAI